MLCKNQVANSQNPKSYILQTPPKWDTVGTWHFTRSLPVAGFVSRGHLGGSEGPPSEGPPCLLYCPVVIVLKCLTTLEQRTLHFHFALCSANRTQFCSHCNSILRWILLIPLLKWETDVESGFSNSPQVIQIENGRSGIWRQDLVTNSTAMVCRLHSGLFLSTSSQPTSLS